MYENNASISGKQNRRPGWTRFLDIALRTAHVLVISILFGGAVFRIPTDQLVPWQHLAMATGLMLIVSEIIHHTHWLTQIRGLMVFIHAGLLGLAILRPDLAVIVLLSSLVFGLVGSHLPKKIRYWSYVLKRVEE
jgi:TctA family transporter